MTIKTKLIGYNLFTTVALLLVLLQTWIGGVNIQKDMREAKIILESVAFEALNAKTDVLWASEVYRSMYSSGSDAKLKDLDSVLTKDRENLEKLLSLTEGNGKVPHAVQLVLESIDQLKNLGNKMVTSAVNQDFKESGKYSKDFSTHLDKTKKDTDFLVQEAKSSAEISFLGTESAVAYVLRSIIVIVAATISINVLFYFLIRRAFVDRLNELMNVFKKVKTGDFSARYRLLVNDEIGRLGEGFNSLLEKVIDLINDIKAKEEQAKIDSAKLSEALEESFQSKNAAEQAKEAGMLQAVQQLESIVSIVSSASERLFTQIEGSSRGAEEQSQHIAETASSMEEMNATVLEVAKNASNATHTADQAKAKAEQGSTNVGQVLKGIEQVQQQSQEMKNDMEKLGKQADSIGQILNVISDIADQTNLLALNAAIEAARAGDAGRGFAVVADEVRKLAEKTMAATKEIGDTIQGIQYGTQQNSKSVAVVAREIEEVTKLAKISGDSLQQIVSLAEVTTDQVRAIATASEEQSLASDGITHRIDDINRVSIETSESMRQSAHAITELANQAHILMHLIEEMKSDSGTGTKELPAGKTPLTLGRG